MTPQEHLESELHNCARYKLSEQERIQLREAGLRDFLYEQITRKKFRRWKLPEAAKIKIDRTLDHCIPQQQPMLVRFRFGGYKLWRLDSTPEVDWAEFFTIVHFANYLAPILAAYQPGAKLMFMSDDVFVERLNNVSKADTEAYYQSFLKLCALFKQYFPSNFDVTMIRHSSLYNSPEDINRELEDKIREIEPTWREKQTPEKLKSSIATSTLNVKWAGVQDLTKLNPKEKQLKIEESAMLHDALVQVPTIRAFSDNNPAMFSIFTTQLPSVVSIGTTKSSVTKFWVGTGVLEEREGRMYDRIISPSQIEQLRGTPSKDVPVTLVPLKNFSSVKVYAPEAFHFDP